MKRDGIQRGFSAHVAALANLIHTGRAVPPHDHYLVTVADWLLYWGRPRTWRRAPAHLRAWWRVTAWRPTVAFLRHTWAGWTVPNRHR